MPAALLADLPYSAPNLCYLLEAGEGGALKPVLHAAMEKESNRRDRSSDLALALPPYPAARSPEARGGCRCRRRRRRLGTVAPSAGTAQEGRPLRGSHRGAAEARVAARSGARQGRRADHGGRVRLNDVRPLRQLPQQGV